MKAFLQRILVVLMVLTLALPGRIVYASEPELTAYGENGWLEIEKGASATLIVTVDIDPQYQDMLVYEWGYYSDDAHENWESLGTTDEPQYTIESVTNPRDYYCRVSAGESSCEAPFTIVLKNHLSARPKDDVSTIKAQPGENVSLEVEVEADDLEGITYEWYETRGAEAFDWMKDIHTNTCVVSNVQGTDQFTCVVRDAFGNNEVVYFDVIIDAGLEAYVAGTDKLTRDERVLQAGQDWEMEVTAEHSQDVDITYLWYKYDYVLQDEETGLYDWTWIPLAGSDTNKYTSTDYIEGTEYMCEVSDTYGNRKCVYFSWHQEAGQDPGGDVPADPSNFSAYGENSWQQVERGKSTTLKVIVEIDPGYEGQLHYEWGYYNDKAQTEWVSLGAADSPEYTISAVTESKEIFCRVSAGTLTREADFHILLENHFSAHAKDNKNEIIVGLGEDASLQVEVEADDPEGITYTWFEGTYDEAFSWVEKIETNTCVIPNVQETRTFTCILYDAYGNSAIVDFTVRVKTGLTVYATGTDGETFIERYVGEGEPWDMSVEIECDPDVQYTITWYRSAYQKVNDNGSVYYDWVRKKIGNANTPVYTAYDMKQDIQYICEVSDEFGNKYSVYFQYRFDAVAKGYDSAYATVEVPDHGTQRLEAKVLSAGQVKDLIYRWYEVEDDLETVVRGPIEGASDAYFDLQNVVAHQNYRCEIENPYGEKTSVYFKVNVQSGYKVYAVGSDFLNYSVHYIVPGQALDLEVGLLNVEDTGFHYYWYVYAYDETEGYKTLKYIYGANKRTYHAEYIESAEFYDCLVLDRYGNRYHIIFNVHVENNYNWNEPTYTWSDDHRMVNAARVSKNNKDHVETESVMTSYEIVEQATCTRTGTAQYTAAFSNAAFEDQTYQVEIPAIGHEWQLSETADDGTLIYVCAHDQTEKMEVRPISVTEGLVDNQMQASSGITDVVIDNEDNRQTLTDSLAEVTRDVLNAQETVIDNDTRENLYQAMDAGADIEAVVEVSSEISDADKNKIAWEVSEDYEVAVFLDIQVALYDDDQHKLGTVSQLMDELEFTITLEPYDINRTYCVFRVHDGEVEKLETIDHKDGTLTFKTSRFSGYAVSTEKPRIEDCEVRLSQELYTYSGEAFEPSVSVLRDGEPLDAGEDYTVTYSNNVNAGTASVTVKGIQTFAGNVTKTFEIEPVDIQTLGGYVEPVESQTYTGVAIEPVPTVIVGAKTLEPGKDFTVTYKNNIKVSGKPAEFTVAGTGNYTGSVSSDFMILPKAIVPVITLKYKSCIYDGTEKTPEITVKDGNTIVSADDYSATYADGRINIGTYEVEVELKGNYTGTGKTSFDIKAASISKASITGIVNKSYTGKVQTQSPVVKVGAATLISGTDYTYVYRNNTKAGTASIVFTGIGNYTDTVTKTFRILLPTPAVSSVTNVNGGVKVVWAKVAGAEKYRVFRRAYNASTKKWSSWVKACDTTAVSYTDKTARSGIRYAYTVRCISADGKIFTSNYNTAGKSITYVAAPVISSIGNVNGGVKIVWPKTAGAAKYRIFRKTGNGKWTALAVATSASFIDKKAVNGTTYSYTIRCMNSKGSFVSAYNTAGRTITYVLRPTISSLTSPKTKRMLVKWDRNAAATGYVIQYSTSSKFASGNKTVTVKGAANVSRTISSLTAKKRYYVRVRTFKTVGRKNYYSAWSAVKNVVTK